MGGAVLGADFGVLPKGVYVSQSKVAGDDRSTELRITPVGEDVVLKGGRLRVCMDRDCVAEVSLRRSSGSALPKDRGFCISFRSELPPPMNGDGEMLPVTGYVLFFHARSHDHFRCVLGPKGGNRIERVSRARVKWLQWLGAWQDFFNAPLD